MNGKSTLNTYLTFRINNIIKIYKELLPKSYYKKQNFEFFVKAMKSKYTLLTLEDFEIDENYSLILEKNNIKDTYLKKIYLSLFNNDIIAKWDDTLSKKDEIIKNKCDVYASTIFITLYLDKCIKINGPLKIKKVPLTGLNKEVKENYKQKEKEINKIILDIKKKTDLFVKNLNDNNFFIKYHEVKSLEKTNIYLSELDYSIKELKEFDKKTKNKILNSKKIINTMKKIEIELLSIDLLDNNKSVILNIDENFLNKVNISFIENNLYAVRKKLFLNINYDQLQFHENEISILKENFNVIFTKGSSEVSFKKLGHVKYFLMNQENTMSFEKTLNELKLSKTEAIILNTIDTNKVFEKGLKYYM